MKWPFHISALWLMIAFVAFVGGICNAQDRNEEVFRLEDAPKVQLPIERHVIGPDHNDKIPRLIPNVLTLSPGQQVGQTTYDHQQNGASGRRIASNPVNDLVHMVWMSQSWFSVPSDRTIRYQAYDPSSASFVQAEGGMIVPREYAGYTSCATLNNGSAVVALHEMGAEMNHFYLTSYYDGVPVNGMFGATVAFPDTEAVWYNEGMELMWPVVEQHYGTESVTYMLGGSWTTGKDIILFRKIGNGYEGSWDGGRYIETITNLAFTIVARQNTDTVAIVFIDDRGGLEEGEGGSHDLDIYYKLSVDQGLTWGAKKNISNYGIDSLWRAFSDFSAMFSSDGNLHVIWSARELQDSIIYYNYRSGLFHWSSDYERVSHIDEANYNMDNNCDPGRWNLYLAKLSLSECDNKLYALYTKFGGEDSPALADCSQEGFANGELYLAASHDYGQSWDTSHNLTNSRTPNADSCQCESDHWSSMPYRGRVYDGALDTLDIVYINDKDAGSIVQSEGNWCSNPVMYLRTACREVERMPQVWFAFGDYAGTFVVDSGQELETTITLENIGNDSLHWTASFAYIDSDNWLQLDDSSGVITYGIGNTQSMALTLNAGGILDQSNQVWTAYLIISSDDPGSPDSIKVIMASSDCIDSDGDGFGDPGHPANVCPVLPPLIVPLVKLVFRAYLSSMAEV